MYLCIYDAPWHDTRTWPARRVQRESTMHLAINYVYVLLGFSLHALRDPHPLQRPRRRRTWRRMNQSKSWTDTAAFRQPELGLAKP